MLSVQGLYAFGLFLATRKRPQDQRAADDMHRAVEGLLAEAGLWKGGEWDRTAEYCKALTHTREGESGVHALQRIVLTKQVVETALTYGRYQAKTLGVT